MEFIGIDFETYGKQRINQVGLRNYMAQQSFKPLIAGVQTTFTESVYDFVLDKRVSTHDFYEFIKTGVAQAKDHPTASRLTDSSRPVLVAFNAAFERHVLASMGLKPLVLDMAVVARAHGASSSLQQASRQLLNREEKEKFGGRLLRKFSFGPEPYTREMLLQDDEAMMDWQLFKKYCQTDARLAFEIAEGYLENNMYLLRELDYAAITEGMNDRGWPVDIELVKAMQKRRDINIATAVTDFRKNYDPSGLLNFNSLKQMKEWCADRGIKATSFAEEQVTKMLGRLDQRLELIAQGKHPSPGEEELKGYHEVQALLKLKQVLGGSSLSKLERILDLTYTKDNRLYDQYVHLGASQSFRTTGAGVQMQNLKRLGSKPDDVRELLLDVTAPGWDNEKMARNIRQVFASQESFGLLMVGDFSSVESRGLAYLAGEQYKLDAYKSGKDMYAVMAENIFGLPYSQISKDSLERQIGKVGELSCGYGAGAGAVQAYAERMGVDMTLEEAESLKNNWRDINPRITQLWRNLEEAMASALALGQEAVAQRLYYTDGAKSSTHLVIAINIWGTPQSLLDIHPGAQSICISVRINGVVQMRRIIHGVYKRGKDFCYYKPNDNKTSVEPWKTTFINPKTGQREYYKIYGGKLAGILTQSFCREIFFWSMSELQSTLECYQRPDLLVGQFHDEIVVETESISAETVLSYMQDCMSEDSRLHGFPLAAEIKYARRYIK